MAEPLELSEVSGARSAVASARISLGKVFRVESSNYILLLGVTLFMVVFGLVMVLSSSAVVSHVDSNNFFSQFWSQGMFAVIGIPLMLVVSRIPPTFWRRVVWLALVGSCALQLVTIATPLGVTINQNRNWLKIGSVTFQPSEGIKIALVLWLGVFLALKQHKIHQWRYSIVPVLLVSGVSIGLVLAGGDLGTSSIMAAFVLGALFFAGIRIKHLVVTVILIATVAILFAISRPSRLARLAAYFQPHKVDVMSTGWQIQQGNFALANGGIFGVGLGNSKSKWSWLPAADTDFIFAIIGEELGLIGAVLVLALFVILAFILLRIIRGTDDPFVRVTTAAIMVWIIGQGITNIGVVLGVVPVLGVPLPLISAGGTALISTLFAIGVVLSFARRDESAGPILKVPSRPVASGRPVAAARARRR